MPPPISLPTPQTAQAAASEEPEEVASGAAGEEADAEKPAEAEGQQGDAETTAAADELATVAVPSVRQPFAFAQGPLACLMISLLSIRATTLG